MLQCESDLATYSSISPMHIKIHQKIKGLRETIFSEVVFPSMFIKMTYIFECEWIRPSCPNWSLHHCAQKSLRIFLPYYLCTQNMNSKRSQVVLDNSKYIKKSKDSEKQSSPRFPFHPCLSKWLLYLNVNESVLHFQADLFVTRL